MKYVQAFLVRWFGPLRAEASIISEPTKEQQLHKLVSVYRRELELPSI